MEVSFQVVGPRGATSASFEVLELIIGKERSLQIMLEATEQFVKKSIAIDGYCTLSITGHFKKFQMKYIEAFSQKHDVFVDSATLYIIGNEDGRNNLIQLLEKKEFKLLQAMKDISALRAAIQEKSK